MDQAASGRTVRPSSPLYTKPPSTSGEPLVSVVIPTYKRPQLLPRAIESVLAQTLTAWELIISDDEHPPGDGRRIAESYARRDGRIRVVTNPGPHSQTDNLNFAMTQARAAWIKPLYDDDEMAPQCLRTMLAAVSAREEIAVARCLANHFVDGRLRRAERRGAMPVLEVVDGPDALLGMFIQDFEVGMPSQMLVRTSAVRAGACMEAPAGVVIGVDWWWCARLLCRGGLALVNETLVSEHQGRHPTVSSSVTHEYTYEESRGLRRAIYDLMPDAVRPPDPRLGGDIVSLVQATWEFKRGRVSAALRRAAAVRNPAAWRHASLWLLRRTFPGRFGRVKRTCFDHIPALQTA